MKKAEAKRRQAQENKKTIPYYFYGFGVQNKTSSVLKHEPKIHSLGVTNKTVSKRTTIKTNEVNRVPASIQKSTLIDELKNTPMTDFEKSYMKNKEEVPRHSGEVDSLIDDLKSYKQDFKKEY